VKIDKGVVAAEGFTCAAAASGVKSKPGALDVGLIVSDRPAVAAGVFTTNRVQAAAVQVSRERLARRTLRGVVVNAGNANACTGERGLADAKRMCEMAGLATGLSAEDFFVASTGIIGRRLPVARIGQGIAAAARMLGRNASHSDALQHAIMTTDLVPKAASTSFRIGKAVIRIGGVAKGSGMIAPRMGTMLSFVTTDCAITKPLLRRALSDAVDCT